MRQPNRDGSAFEQAAPSLIAIRPAYRRDNSKPSEPTHTRQRRWLGDFQIRYLARLGWIPLGFFRRILGEMLRRGLLIMFALAGPALKRGEA